MDTLAGNGVALSGLSFKNWQGTIVDPKRAPIQANCASGAPCTGITFSNLSFWSDTNAAIHYTCASAYGSGYCLKAGSGGSYSAITQTVSSPPAGYNGPKMSADLAAGLGVSVSIPIPSAIPTSFYPGVKPATALMNGNGPGASSGGAVTTTLVKTTSTKPATSTTTTAAGGSGGACAAVYGQCGGSGFTGAACCASGSTCK